MNINILRYSLFGIAGGQEVDRNFSEIYYLPSYNDCIVNVFCSCFLHLHNRVLNLKCLYTVHNTNTNCH